RTCDATNNNQKWVLSHIGNGVYEFFNVGASKCMDVTDGKNADHTPIQLWGCNGSTSMRWTANPSFDGVAQVKSETGGRCLDVFGDEGAQLSLIHCTGFGNLAQIWRFPTVWPSLPRASPRRSPPSPSAGGGLRRREGPRAG